MAIATTESYDQVLDAAKAGGYTLRPLLRDIAAATSLQVQTGGGVRTRDDVAALLDAGATRVVIGSLAVRDPASVLAWIGEFGSESITVALDTRRDTDGVWRLPVHGWTETASETLDDLLRRYAVGGLRHLLCTDIDRDGMLTGPNIALYRDIRAAHPVLELQASGGMRDVADVIDARNAGCAGAVLGKALLEGRLSLPEALQC